MVGTLFLLMLGYFLPVATAVTTSAQFLESITAQVHTGLGAAAVPKGLAVLHSHKVFMPLVFNIGHHEFIPDAIKTPDWSKICPKWSNGSCLQDYLKAPECPSSDAQIATRSYMKRFHVKISEEIFDKYHDAVDPSFYSKLLQDVCQGVDDLCTPHTIPIPEKRPKRFIGALAALFGGIVTEGEVLYQGKNLLEMLAEERAREGVFLAFQYPVEIPGVNNAYFLKAALNAVRKHRGETEFDAMDFLKLVREKVKLVELDEELINRPVNEGFSGGEKKRNEIFQMAVLEPTFAILDETDSGLDIDALKIVSGGVNAHPEPRSEACC